MKRLIILLFLLTSASLLAQDLGRTSGYRSKGKVRATELETDGNTTIGGKLAVVESLRVELTSLFKGNATFQADILMTGTVSETLEVIGTAPTILMVDNDDVSSDTLSITMDDSLAKFDGSTFVIDTDGNLLYMSGNLTLDDDSGDSPLLYLKCAGDKILSLQKLDAGNAEIKNDEGDIVFEATGADVISKESLTIGDGTAVDYVLKFDAENADGTITWDEDPGEFDISADINVIGDVGGTTIGGITEANLVDKTAAEEISGVWEIQDDTKLTFGNDADFSIEYDEDGDNVVVFDGADINVNGNYIKNAKLEYSLAQGVSWNQGASSSVLTRLGSLTGIAVSVSAGDSALPVQSSMKRCLLNDDGTVNYYLNPDSSYMKQYSTVRVSGTATTNTESHLVDTGADFVTDGVVAGMYAHNVTDDYYSLITAVAATDLTLRIDAFPDGNEVYVIGNADLDGTDGQVMVEIPKFYVKHTLAGSVHSWYISKYHLSGFSVHPFFLKDGIEVDHRYVGAYEACIWDNSAGVYLGGETDIVDTAADKLASVVGTRPHTNETRAEYRSIAENRGQGWHQYDSWAHAALQLLYIIEYADFNSQTVIGNGNTSYDAWNYVNNIGYCGYSNPDGNGTNASVTAEDGLGVTDPNDGITNREYVSYRGVENFYGSVWQWIDGINVDTNREVYLCYMYSNYADDTSTDYEDIGTLATSDGYINNILDYSFGFLPSGYSGNSSTYLCDYFYQASGAWRVVGVGGRAADGVTAGVFDFVAPNASSEDSAAIGARILY